MQNPILSNKNPQESQEGHVVQRQIDSTCSYLVKLNLWLSILKGVLNIFSFIL